MWWVEGTLISFTGLIRVTDSRHPLWTIRSTPSELTHLYGSNREAG